MDVVIEGVKTITPQELQMAIINVSNMSNYNFLVLGTAFIVLGVAYFGVIAKLNDLAYEIKALREKKEK